MWSLKNILDSKYFYLLVGHDYTVGRKESDILIENDMSISRKHAVLKVIHNERNMSNSETTSKLIIKDVSKLGTQLPNKRISNGDEEILRKGDTLSFGTLTSNKFEVICEPFIVTASCLPSSAKKNLKKMVFKLGGNLLNEWSKNCSYVVMLNLSLTVKVACALLSQKHVVTPCFFEDFLNNITRENDKNTLEKLPSPQNYLPIMAESQVNSSDVSFDVNPERAFIFKEKNFVFLFSDQFNRLKPVIELGSGSSTFYDVSQNDFSIDSNIKQVLNQSCVILPDSNNDSMQHQNKIHSVIQYLNKNNRYMIPESELGFAILYCSTEKYCNPYKKSKNSFSQNSQSSQLNKDGKLFKESVSSSSSHDKSESLGNNIFQPKTEHSRNAIYNNANDIKLDEFLPKETNIKKIVNKKQELLQLKNVNNEEVEVSDEYYSLDEVKTNEHNKINNKRKLSSDEDHSPPKKLFKSNTTKTNTVAKSDEITETTSSNYMENNENVSFETNNNNANLDAFSLPRLRKMNSNSNSTKENLIINPLDATIVEWNGRLVKNFKRFIKVKPTYVIHDSIIYSTELHLQPKKTVSTLDMNE